MLVPRVAALRHSSVRGFRSWFRAGDIIDMGAQQSLLATQEAGIIQEMVKDNCVVVFSKTTCGYCRMAKKVFEDIGTPYVAVELNRREDGGKMQSVLQAMTGEATVPRVFVNGQCIGGGSETRKLHRGGGLIPLLSQCTPRSVPAQADAS